MQKIAKKKVLFLVAAVFGLLLGGNVRADGGAVNEAASGQLEQQISQIRQRISELTVELEKNQASQKAETKTVLTQEQLDNIESEVKRIAGETARLKLEVGIFVALREIKEKVNSLSGQVAQLTAAKSGSSAPAAGTGTPDRVQTEAKIAQIKQQINELNQELQSKKAGEQKQEASGSEKTEECRGDSCPAAPSSDKTAEPSAPVKTETPKAEAKGFWQSVGDFFKKLFTF